MSDAFASYIRPGYPRRSNSDSGDRTEIQYVGPASALKLTTADEISPGVSGTRPVAGQAWSPYNGRVSISEYEPLPGTNPEYGIVTIACEIAYGVSSGVTGTAQETSYEIEWVEVSRPLAEHPKFRVGGGGTYALVESDLVQIQQWREEQDTAQRALFNYYARDKNGVPSSTLSNLNSKQIVYCKFLLAGVETYTDFAPVARKSTTYVGGPPATSDAGSLEGGPTPTDPSGFPNLPSGWQWLKSADRSLRSGGQTRWVQTEEWTGAQKVLLDKNDLYYGI